MFIALVAAACNKSTTSNTQTPAAQPPLDSSNSSSVSQTPDQTTNQTATTPPTTQTQTQKSSSTTTTTQTPPPPSPPAVKNFSVTADDSVATPSTITVNRSDKVNLTLSVSTSNVYYGGLDFRSSVVNSGTILPGASKTVSFTADSSFTINCFWPSSGVEKTSHIDVVVK